MFGRFLYLLLAYQSFSVQVFLRIITNGHFWLYQVNPSYVNVPLRISSINVSCGFGHICWRNPFSCSVQWGEKSWWQDRLSLYSRFSLIILKFLNDLSSKCLSSTPHKWN